MSADVTATQPPIESLRNALQIAQGWGEDVAADHTCAAFLAERAAFADIARLIRHALSQLEAAEREEEAVIEKHAQEEAR